MPETPVNTREKQHFTNPENLISKSHILVSFDFEDTVP